MRLFDSPSELLVTKKIFWVGAVSFEPRCTGSISSLLESGFEIASAIAFDYPTKLSPKNSGEQRRAGNRLQFKQLLGSSLGFRPINAYRYAEFIGELYRISREMDRIFDQEAVQLVVDITCLTKVHTLALAYWLLSRGEGRSVCLAYSQPEYYGNPSKNIWGKGKWHGTTLVRLDLESTETYEATHAIILMGHEGDRLRLALSEIEPSNALIIKAIPKDPKSDLLTVSDVQNSWLFLEMKEGIRQGFSKEVVQTRDLPRLISLTTQYCKHAKQEKARIVLCPFGPKPFVFCAGYACLSEYRSNVWLSYPRPVSYDPDYSEGYNYTLWFSTALD